MQIRTHPTSGLFAWFGTFILLPLHFRSDDDVIADVDNFLQVHDVDFYQEGSMIQKCLNKCVNEGGHYVEMLKTKPKYNATKGSTIISEDMAI